MERVYFNASFNTEMPSQAFAWCVPVKKVHAARTETPLFACLRVFHSVRTEVAVWHSQEIALHITSLSLKKKKQKTANQKQP